MNKLKLYALSAALFCSVSLSFAQDYNYSFKTINLLTRQIYLMNQVEDFVEKQDFSRLLVTKSKATSALINLQSKGALHIDTLQSLQELVIAYEYSKDMYSLIKTKVTESQINELHENVRSIAEQTGLSKSFRSRITISVFSQVKLLFDALSTQTTDEELLSRIKQLYVPLAYVLAKADLGDTLVALNESKELLTMLEDIEPLFDRVIISDPVFDIVIELKGLTEFYRAALRIEIGDES